MNDVLSKFDDLARKSTCEVYTLQIPKDIKWRCAWGKIIIDSDAWMFSCLSDAGNFSYRWPYEEHRTFKEFLTQIDVGYLMRKIEPRAKEFDFEATVKNIKQKLFESRRCGDLNKYESRAIYVVIQDLEYETSEDLVMHQLIEGHEWFSDDYCWTADLIVKKHTPEVITFTEVVFPLFQEALKIELETN